ncbi:RidA family protein [Vibrio sp. DW001]|uniref:RidA family protein n=1 Tax=Vibrio sp. DW001 TaxID=2912315 RepID=UPI0023B1E934|nr:RidA family protein [Vibrio sp. DW001]WED28246.1 RidA family protein [Vibrio sp. DW001]
MKRITVSPFDQYAISTFVIHNEIIEISHFGGSIDSNGNMLKTIEEQTIQTFDNLQGALKEIGLSLNNVVKVTVILSSIDDFKGMHDGWLASFNKDNYPARTTITSNFVDDNCLIQIDAVGSIS